MVVQPGLCWTWSEPPKTGFLRTRLICWMRGSISQLLAYEADTLPTKLPQPVILKCVVKLTFGKPLKCVVKHTFGKPILVPIARTRSLRSSNSCSPGHYWSQSLTGVACSMGSWKVRLIISQVHGQVEMSRVMRKHVFGFRTRSDTAIEDG